jgi:hypothetical protein
MMFSAERTFVRNLIKPFRLALLPIILLMTGNAAAVQFAGGYVVTDPPFGAKADGVTDDTLAFTSAMAVASGVGGGVVEVPAGIYLISGSLEVPSNVTLEGVSPRFVAGADPLAPGGSVLLATNSAGDADGTPFIRLNTVSVLKGLTVHYPDQTDSVTPTAYPWTVRGNAKADNCTLIDVTIVNAYQGVDFGTYDVGRHWIDGLAAQAFLIGLYVHQCYDVGRLRNVYFGPIWTTGPAAQYMRENGVAFRFGRTDGEQASTCRAEGYNIGFHFIRGPIGTGTSPGSGVMKDASTTDCAVSFYVEDVGDNAGWSFVGGIFEGVVSNGSNQKGEFKFYESTFQQPPGASRHVQLILRSDLQKPFFFERCTFGPLTGPGPVAIDCNNYAVIVMNCTFDGLPGDVKVRLGAEVREAVVVRNTMHNGVTIENGTTSGADVQVGLNVSGEGEGEGIAEGEGQPEGIAEGEGMAEGEGTPEGEGQPEGSTEGIPEGQPEGVVEGEGQPEGLTEGEGPPATVHTADQNGDGVINLTELLRVIQFFNIRGFHCVTPPETSEDGFLPGAGGNQSCAAHASDYAPQNWQISLTELLRMIQFFNIRAYHACPDQGTEDGYCPGTA